MTRKQKIILVSFFAFCGAAAYGVYWWHEASLDHIAKDYISYSGPKLDEVRQFLADDKPAEARARMNRLAQYEKIGILKVLDRDRKTSVRMFAVRYMRAMREVPAIRAELARMAQSDADPTVSRLAARALQGRR